MYWPASGATGVGVGEALLKLLEGDRGALTVENGRGLERFPGWNILKYNWMHFKI